MVIVVYDVRGVIVCNFVLYEKTVIAQYIRDFLVQQVRRGVGDKRPDDVDSTIILHDNARPHKAECVRQLLRCWVWENLESLPYSPDISPCDFDLIPKIKEPLSGRRFATREDIDKAACKLMTRFTHGEANAVVDVYSEPSTTLAACGDSSRGLL